MVAFIADREDRGDLIVSRFHIEKGVKFALANLSIRSPVKTRMAYLIELRRYTIYLWDDACIGK